MATKKKSTKKAVKKVVKAKAKKSTGLKTRFEVSARNKKGDLVARNLRYTEKNAQALKKKTLKRKGIKSVTVNPVK